MKDYITSIILLIISIMIFVLASSYGKEATNLSSNSALLPQLISGTLAILSVVNLFQRLKRNEKEQSSIYVKTLIKLLLLVALLIAYIPALYFFGYLVATILFLITIMTFLGYPILKSSLHTLVISGSLYIIFAEFFHVSLPQGILW
ncbi:tripartite tricarboxylate transporter TctB family protein [Thalassobacillus devorans]|uniref:tripartite tricarboxylate transporter TctB family protein n=1 Tax=Thalassobacillus devorans TaxID=279813 RepID=UPI000A1CC765|nr:tripartite tricarboxylate transporter TctB family protein [Thalassobacillus devorans]